MAENEGTGIVISTIEVGDPLYWIKLDPKLEEMIGTEMSDDIKVYLESELRDYLKDRLPRITLKAKHKPVEET